MATEKFINELKNRANANRLGRFELQMYDRFEKELKGDTKQDGTPTPDTPVEIQSVTGLQNVGVCGKNLLPFTNQDYTLKGIHFYVQNGNLYLDGTSTGEISGNSLEHKQNFSFWLEPGTYHFERGSSAPTYIRKYSNNSTLVTNSGTFTLEKKTQVFLGIYIYQMSFDNQLLLCQLEKGSTATEYEPYKGITYEVNLGKNLFDKDKATLNYRLGSDGTPYSDSSYVLSDYIPVLPSSYYMYSRYASGGGSGAVAFYDSNKTFISRTLFGGSSTSNTYIQITTPANTKYIRLTDLKELLNNMQIEKGTKSTSFSPYFTPIELNKIGTYQDRIYKDNGKWYVEKQIGKIILDGSETYETAGTNTSGKYKIRYADVINLIKKPANANTIGDIISNQFIPLSANDTYRCNQGISVETNGKISFYDETITQSTSSFTTWLASNNMTIKYVLATPTYTEITNTELIEQLESIELLKGTNNITITSENLPIIFDYSFWNGDTEVDVDDRFLEINQSNHLTKIELKDSCCVNNNLLGTTYTKSAEVELLDLPMNTKLESQIITPEIGVKYNDDTTEYETFDDYVIESVDDKQTGSNTKFTAMNGGTLLDKEYECSLSFEDGETHTINEFYQDACSQIGLTPTDTTFDNSEIVMTGNPFTNRETIRTVISEVEKTSCSIAKFNWKNKTASMTWLSDQIDYEFNTNDYSTLEGSLTQYGPLNTIIIANAELNGENVVMKDDESVAKDGEHQIVIDSPYFLYTEALRRQAIEAIYNKLVGLTYYDIKLTTPYGKPFLKLGNKIRINTNEGQTYDTYVLTHTLTYDGTIQSIIESPALTQEEQTIQNNIKNNTIKERVKRTELMVDKTTGDITAITDRVTTVENEFGDVYSKEEVNTLVQNSATGITNTFVNSGGNNLLRNTGLWFEDRSTIEYMYPRTTGLYPSDELYMSADPHWEYWKGNAKKVKEDKAANMSGILLQTGYFEQTQQVRNGTYTLSFKYRKLVELATVNVQINDRYIDLTNIEDTEIIEVGEITSQTFNIKIFSDTDDSCVIYDLMLNAGSEKAEYSQHQNETTTDTVNISKGITIQSSDTNTTFKANSDGIRVYNSKDMDTPITEYTDTGMDTNRIKVKEEAEIIQVLWKNVGNNTWISRL